MCRIEVNSEDRRRPFRTLLSFDRQLQNGILVIESFHSELAQSWKRKVVRVCFCNTSKPEFTSLVISQRWTCTLNTGNT